VDNVPKEFIQRGKKNITKNREYLFVMNNSINYIDMLGLHLLDCMICPISPAGPLLNLRACPREKSDSER